MSPPTGARYTAEYRPVFLKQTALKPASEAAEAATLRSSSRCRSLPTWLSRFDGITEKLHSRPSALIGQNKLIA
jgi:hypothetical protein